MEDDAFPYATAAAFNSALRDRIAAIAADSNYSIQELRRQFAYDRLLVRAFRHNPEPWILKGGGGLLARIPGQARHSMDVDLFYQGELATAIGELQELAADEDFGDFFTFAIERSPHRQHPVAHAAGLSVITYLGDTEFQPFAIDLVIVSNMTQQPETIEAPVPVVIPGLPTAHYRVYPLVDHIADNTRR